MIKVDRPAAPACLDLNDPESAAFAERKAILDHLAAHGSLPAEKSFTIYRDAVVKDLLIAMFKGKCAYCEIHAVGGSDGDIEHFRPKGGITDADAVQFAHPGYWWLAMAWTNLVLSCQHCNQSRRQLIHEPGLGEAEIERELTEKRLRTTGKKNRFPVAGNIWVVDHNAALAGESPLLIDPTIDQPETMLEWEFERSISTVKAKNGDPRAMATIDILGLNRRNLTEARVTILNEFRATRQKILKRLNQIADEENTSPEAAETLRQTVLEDLDDFKLRCRQESLFAGMARAFRNKLAEEVSRML
jgi:uncharacterized protein (TIGR02646 family)